ncbi:hypothetical protein FFJ24_007845 [Pedobacter sp. KBS0701]|jgi:hypothetical protein|uniref:hypothetical protein n=1 Tax=Pedobacter sp. KBS0701 TaxID=2578106 RepID=UPI00110D29C4|nr:hypothetical protein [Pedobacter sp. KBS0701]QDW24730.1 hypothetical protein FFJ24_007845 [Pedobacter sp. KBS0701]
MKKNIELESLSNEDIFGTFEKSRLNTLATSNIKGGTSTTLCKTDESALDEDTYHSQESLKDKRCSGTITEPLP